MAFTEDQGFSQPAEGQDDWDTDLRANFTIAERGFHLQLRATTNIASGIVVTLDSSGWAVPYNPHSYDLRPFALSITNIDSGTDAYFLRAGRVRSMDVWSGHLTIGRPVFTAPASVGFPVNSEAGALRPIGYALEADAIAFSPFDFLDIVSEVVSLAVVVGSTHDFSLTIGPRGTCRKLTVLGNSLDAYRIQFWSGSSRVGSELLYQTATTSVDGGAQDFDVNTLNYVDAALFPFIGTDVASPYLIFGRVSPQSASSVGSDSISVTFLAERY